VAQTKKLPPKDRQSISMTSNQFVGRTLIDVNQVPYKQPKAYKKALLCSFHVSEPNFVYTSFLVNVSVYSEQDAITNLMLMLSSYCLAYENIGMQTKRIVI